MTNTVRGRILEAIQTALAAVTDVGVVADDATLSNEQVAAQLDAGKFAIDLIIGDDDTEGVEQVLTKESFVFDLAAVVHLPIAKLGATRPSVLAAGIYADLYLAVMGGDGNGETWGGLALKTEMRGGGGVAFDEDRGTRCTLLAARVWYRHTCGDPTTP